MKNYTITVNGTVYDVSVEEKGASAAPAASAPVPAAAPGTGGRTCSTGATGSSGSRWFCRFGKGDSADAWKDPGRQGKCGC